MSSPNQTFLEKMFPRNSKQKSLRHWASACAGLQSRLAPRLSPYSANLLSELPRCILLVMRGLLIVATFLFSLTAKADDWGPLQFLVGQWTGEGGGEPGQGSGSFSFTPDLQGKILVRKNFAEYPPSNGKPAYRHDDLMVIYRDGPSRQLRAIYFDSAEHTIEYSINPLDGGVMFVSEGP